MASLKKTAGEKALSKPQIRSESLRPEEKIARMLAILALQSFKGRPEQAAMLRTGGFTHTEIAEMLDTNEQGVSSLLYQAKQKKGKMNGTD
jgi:DNA-directed RNA polymerase specialized sigma24 family protein